MRNFVSLLLTISVLALGINAIARPVVIAHRGASGYVPEHTLAAVAMAHAWRPDFIEPDVVLTKDSVPVVLHDIHLEETTNVEEVFPSKKRSDGRWYAIDLTVAEVQRLSVHERAKVNGGEAYFAGRFPVGNTGLRVPTLVEYIQLVQGLNQSTGRTIGIYPEIKEPAFHEKEGKDITRSVLDILGKFGYLNSAEHLFLQCFESQPLRRIRKEYGKKVRLVQLIGENSWKMDNGENYDQMQTGAGIKKVAEYADGIGAPINRLIGKDGIKLPLIEHAKSQRLLIHAYTLRLDQLPEGISGYAGFSQLAKGLLGAGVDGIFSDHADRLLDVVEAKD